MEIAIEYGQAPHEVEQWPAYWFNRAAFRMIAKNKAERNRAERAAKRK